MMFTDAKGRRRRLPNYSKYKIDWEAKSRSKLQRAVKEILFGYWNGEFVYEELPVIGTRLTIDFFNATQDIAIEVDGKQHIEYNKFFHGGNRMNFLSQLERDEQKENFCQSNNIMLYRINEGEDLLESVKRILD